MNHHTTRALRALGASTLTLGLALGLAACGDGGDEAGSSTQASATEHNDADVAFASDMLQHHAQALAMVDLTLGRTLDPEVQALAEQIREAQAPEIETFTDWLTEWDEEVPATVRDYANAGHHSGGAGEEMEGMDTDMPGMMSADQMTALDEAPDAEFEDLWLEMMIEHHTGAIEMATTETEDGQYQPALDVADSIITSQTAEVEAMDGLLD